MLFKNRKRRESAASVFDLLPEFEFDMAMPEPGMPKSDGATVQAKQQGAEDSGKFTSRLVLGETVVLVSSDSEQHVVVNGHDVDCEQLRD